MGANARSTLWPRDAVAWLPLPHSETTVPSSSVAPTAPIQAAHSWEGSASPTFDEVLARYQDAIYRYAFHLTRNRVAADEVYQETVLKAYREFDRLAESASHRPWLYRIATNAFLNNRHQRSNEGSIVEASTEFVPPKTAVRLEAADLLAEVAALVANLPVRQRLALIQRMYHDLSYTEIAASLHCSEVTARTSVHQALRTLREHFGERL
jgi:RNA polymerase sigma factor (sigma-70 family)